MLNTWKKLFQNTLSRNSRLARTSRRKSQRTNFCAVHAEICEPRLLLTTIIDAEGQQSLQDAYTTSTAVGGQSREIAIFGSSQSFVSVNLDRSASSISYQVNADSALDAFSGVFDDVNGAFLGTITPTGDTSYLSAMSVSVPGIRFDPFLADGSVHEVSGSVTFTEATGVVTDLNADRTFGNITHVQVRQGPTISLGQLTEYVFSGTVTSTGSRTFTRSLNINSFSILAATVGSTDIFARVRFFQESTVPFVTDSNPAPGVTVLGLSNITVSDGDTSPSSSDGTNFGSVTQGGSGLTRTFTVSNTGNATLTTSGLSVPSGYTVTNTLSSSIAPGSSDTFSVRLDATTVGTKSGQISFTTNDSDENPYNFSITGVVSAVTTPEVSVAGISNVTISDGDTSPSSTDGTDFGSVTQGGSSLTRTFTVSNTGNATLTTSGLSVPSGYTVTDPLSGSIAAGSSDTFTVRLDATTVGTKSGQISFTTNDSDENPYNFAITGTVTGSPPANAELAFSYVALDDSSRVIGSGTSLSPGDIFTLQVFAQENVANIEGINSLALDIDFDESLVEAIGYDSSAIDTSTWDIEFTRTDVGDNNGDKFIENLGVNSPTSGTAVLGNGAPVLLASISFKVKANVNGQGSAVFTGMSADALGNPDISNVNSLADGSVVSTANTDFGTLSLPITQFAPFDLNQDGNINSADLGAIRAQLLARFNDGTHIIPGRFDLNSDGNTNSADIGAIRAELLRRFNAANSARPASPQSDAIAISSSSTGFLKATDSGAGQTTTRAAVDSAAASVALTPPVDMLAPEATANNTVLGSSSAAMSPAGNADPSTGSDLQTIDATLGDVTDWIDAI